MSAPDELWLPPSADPRPQGRRKVENVVRAVPALAPAAVSELAARERELRRRAKKVARARARAERQASRRRRSK